MGNLSRRAFLAVASVAALAGCSGGVDEEEHEPTPTSSTGENETDGQDEPSPLEVVESGWSVSEHGYVFYGIGIENPNLDKECDYPSFTVTGKTADGSILFNDEQTLYVVFPGETVYYGFQVGNGTAPDTVEFTLGDCTWYDATPLDESAYTIENTSEVVGDFNQVSYTGELTANFSVEASPSRAALYQQTALTVILRDASGAIVYGMSSFVDTPEKDNPTPFEILAYDVPKHASYEIYAQLW